jgi:hypothetical protein
LSTANADPDDFADASQAIGHTAEDDKFQEPAIAQLEE